MTKNSNLDRLYIDSVMPGQTELGHAQKRGRKFILQVINYIQKKINPSYHSHLKNTAIAMKIDRTSEIPERGGITFIQTDNDSKKKGQRYWNRVGSREKGEKAKNKFNK